MEEKREKIFQSRTYWMIGSVWILVCICTWRLAVVQITESETYKKKAKNQQEQRIKSPPVRGKIVDRNHRDFATTTLSYDLCVSPREAKNSQAGRLWTEGNLREAGYTPEEIKEIRKARTPVPPQLPDSALEPLAEDIASFSQKNPNDIFKLLKGEGRQTTRTRTIRSETRKSIPMAYASIFGFKHFFPEDVFNDIKTEKIKTLEPMDEIVRRNVSQEMRDKFMAMFDRNRLGDSKNGIRPRYTYTTSSMSIVSNNVVYFNGSNNRNYPQGSVAGTIIGLTRSNEYGDNEGASGLELVYNDRMKGTPDSNIIRVTAGQRKLDPVTTSSAGASRGIGNTIVMTIDERLQRETERALQHHVTRLEASGGQAIVLDVKTGEVLAMASSPEFDPSKRIGDGKNRSVNDAVEPGSVMKIFIYTSAMDAGKITPDMPIDCGGITWTMSNGRRITDTHAIGTVPVIRAFAESSNIGSVKVFNMLGATAPYTAAYNALSKFGFGQITGIDLPFEHPGKFRKPNGWSGLSMGSLAQGYEILVTPIQVAAAVAAIGNNGTYMQPHVVKAILDPDGAVVENIEPKPLRQVCKPETAKNIRTMMEQVVLDGTAMSARLDDWRVGGKTGTTMKAGRGGYGNNTYVGSFCGLAPINDPKFAIYVWVDNPTTANKMYFGGWSAAPVFRDIAEVALEMYKIPKEQPEIVPQNKVGRLNLYRNSISRALRRVFVEPTVGEQMTTSSISTQNFADTINSLNADEMMQLLAPGTMPDLRGKTMREAADTLKGINAPFEVKGTGFVISQSPEPHLPLSKDDKIVITLGTRTQAESALFNDTLLGMPTSNPMETTQVLPTEEAPAEPARSTDIVIRVGNETIALPATNTKITPVQPTVVRTQQQQHLPGMQQLQDTDSRIGKTVPSDFSSAWQSYDLRKLSEEQRKNRPTQLPTTKPADIRKVPAEETSASTSTTETTGSEQDAKAQTSSTTTVTNSQAQQRAAVKSAYDLQNANNAQQGNSATGTAGSNLLRNRVPANTTSKPGTQNTPATGTRRSFYDYNN